MDLTTFNVLVGAGSALAGVVISAISQYFLIAQKSRRDLELSDYQNFRKMIEETHSKLGRLSLMLSISKADMAHGEEKLKYFNDNYDKANDLMSDIIMACAIYFPNLKKEILPIEDEANLYWGYFKAVLVSNGGASAKYVQENASKAAIASINCAEIIKKVKLSIEKMAQENIS